MRGDCPKPEVESRPVCTFCGQPIAGESAEPPNLCEYCSSPTGGYPHAVVLSDADAGSAARYLEGASNPRILIGIARMLLDRNDDKLCGIVTIVAHLACEVAVERSLSDSFAGKGLRFLEDPLGDALNGYNIADDTIRKVYTAVTGDEIRHQPFWDSFVRSAKRRDHVVRRGLIVSRADAEESCKAASDLVAHLSR